MEKELIILIVVVVILLCSIGIYLWLRAQYMQGLRDVRAHILSSHSTFAS